MFDALLLLVRSPGKAFSKQELMAAVWPDSYVEEANLSFQISMLRKALGDDAAQWIQTVPKHGYRFAGNVTIISPQTTQSPVASAPPVDATRTTTPRLNRPLRSGECPPPAASHCRWSMG
jgi:DNA-binding winged helix-turn-helix (wHTH) protein